MSAAAIWPDSHPPAGDYGGPLIGSWWGRPQRFQGLEVVANPWNGAVRIAEAEQQVWDACQLLLPPLAAALGGRDEDWWRLVLMPWLVCVTSVVEDCRTFALAAAEAAPGAPVIRFERRAGPPSTMGVSVAQLRSPRHHRVLVGEVAEALGMATRPALDADERAHDEDAQEAGGATAGRRSPAAAGREFLSRVLLERAKADVAVIGQSGMTGRQAIALRRAAGARTVPGRASAFEPPAARDESRDRLRAAALEGDALAALVSRLLADLAPRSVLEGRDELVSRASAAYGAPSHLLVGNYGADEDMNTHMAQCAAAGRRVDHAQHGGFYLQARVNAQERLELREGSSFLAWRDTPSPHLERIRDTHERGDAVVVIEGLNPPDPFVIRFASAPLGNQGYESAEQLARFAAALGDSIPVTLSRFPRKGAHRPPALERLPAAAGAGAVAAMRGARLALVSYPDTPFTEAMVLGVPVIGLWNPEHWEVRDEARPAFERLRAAGVIFDSPEEAAARVREVHGHAPSWWREGEVARARAEYVDAFAPAGDWLTAWSRHLRAMQDGGRPEPAVSGR